MLSATMSLASVKPRLEHVPEGVIGTWGPRVFDFVGELGVTLDDWQAYCIDALFAVREDGTWASTEAGLLVSRQNGKGEILVAYDLAHLFLFPRQDGRRKTTLHSAHEFKTAIDGFQRLQGVIEANETLMERVAPGGIRVGNDQPGITLAKRKINGKMQQLGDRCRFIARSRNSGRGFAADVLVSDEAQEYSFQARNALTYTQSTVPNRQELLTGTAPTELNNAEVFEGVRDRGRQHTGKRTAWLEYSPEGSEDPKAYIKHPKVTTPPKKGQVVIDLGDRRVWEQAIPSLGIRIQEEVVEEQVERATDITSLAIERFSIWPDPAPEEETVYNEINLDTWGRHADERYRVTEEDAEIIAVALGRGGGYATISLSRRFDDDLIAVTHAITGPQTIWVAAELARLKAINPGATIILDPKNAGPIITHIQTAGLTFLAMNLAEIAAAHGYFIEAVNAGLVVHPDQKEVTESIKYAMPRAIGMSGFTWEFSEPTKPISHAQTVTWAVWGVTKREANPPKEPAVLRGHA